MPAATARRKALRLARRPQGLSTRELNEAGIHRQVLSRLVAEGQLERVARGHYRPTQYPATENSGLVTAAAAAPNGVICLLSALGFHGIGTQLPFQVWMAVERRARKPTFKHPELRLVRPSGPAFAEGIEVHRLEGRAVRIYGVAKTIADCFKYRNKIGLDVALEALRDAWRRRLFRMEDLHRYAGICRVQRVMRPYLEALVA